MTTQTDNLKWLQKQMARPYNVTASRRGRPKRFNRYYTEQEHPINSYNQMNKDIFLAASDLNDYFTDKIVSARNEADMHTHHDTFSIYASKKEWKVFMNTLTDLRRMQTHENSGYFFNDEKLSYLQFQVHSTHVTITLIGDKEFCIGHKCTFEDMFEFVTNQIEWIYSNDGNSIEIPLRHDRMPVKEMYPFLGDQTLEEFYEGFMESSASILLLIGPPGTGKTTFIRGMLQHLSASAMVSYDAAVLEKDYLFAQFIEGDKSVMVLEDADMFLKSRKEGNTMMHKFLNVGDGLVTTKNKKMVFSTNLPSISDIDPALVRPGRCYDILKFEELNQTQAEALAKKMNVTIAGTREKWSIADVFFEQNTNVNKPTERKMGFV
jgi:hypothetical protein